MTSIFLDVGSTNSRAWAVCDGRILRRQTAAVGVRDSARDGSTKRVREAVRELIAALAVDEPPARIAAAGMITSSLGLAEVPHVPAPAGIEDLACAAVAFGASDIAAGVPILLVPGVRTVGDADDALTHDVMRGEETLAIGLVSLGLLPAGGALLNVGSHWKLIRIDAEGRVGGSRTSLGGEVVHAVHTGTLLSASLPEGPLGSPAPAWIDAGAAAARRDGLFRAMFGVRLMDQHRQTTTDERLSFLVGACIAEDLDALRARGTIADGMRLLVSGPAGVPSAWVHLLREAGCEAVALDAETTERAFVIGLAAIERARAG